MLERDDIYGYENKNTLQKTILVLSDIMKVIKAEVFKERFPDITFNVGTSEQSALAVYIWSYFLWFYSICSKLIG